MRAALEAITDTMIRYVAASFEAGADGLFYATQTATPEVLTDDESDAFGASYDRVVLAAAKPRSHVTLLHVHGKDIFFDQMAALAPHALNWHDRVTSPSLADAHRRFGGALFGGLSEHATLASGPAAAIAAEVADAVRQTHRTGLVVAPGCVLPLATPDAHLAAVVAAVKGTTA